MAQMELVDDDAGELVASVVTALTAVFGRFGRCHARRDG